MSSTLQKAITDYMNSKMKKDNNTAKRGVIRDNHKVQINGNLYDYESAVDVQFSVNEYVWCILTDNRNMAVIIGK